MSDPQTPGTAVSPPSAPSHELFGTVRARPRSYRWVWLVFAMVVAAGVGFALHQDRNMAARVVVTPAGFFTVYRGMPEQEVTRMLGAPIAQGSSAGGEHCIQYGHPHADEQAVILYSVCFRDGKVTQVTEKKYAVWTVGPDGLPSSK